MSIPTNPNILLIITDQMRSFQHWPEDFYSNLPGYKWFQNPSRNTVQFKNTMISTSMCSPSRASFLTSTYQCENGVPRTEDQLDSSYPNLFKMLGHAGYTIYYKGKWHLTGPDPAEEDGQKAKDFLVDYGVTNWNPPDAGTGVDHQGGGKPDNDARYLSGLDIGLLESGANTLTGVKVAESGPNKGKIVYADGTLYDQESVLETLDALKNAPPAEPWIIVASFVNPHDIRHFEFGKDAPYAPNIPEGVPAPPTAFPTNFADELSYKPEPQTAMAKMEGIGPGVLDQSEGEAFLGFYSGITAQVEGQVATILDAVEADFPDTLIIRMADHGEHGLSHQQRHKGGTAYEESIRVPLIFCHPDLPANAPPVDQVVSLLDLVPTIEGLVDSKGYQWESSESPPVPHPLRGSSLVDVLNDPSGPAVHPNGVVYSYDDMLSSQPVRALRTEKWKYAITYPYDLGTTPQAGEKGKVYWELYNLEDDSFVAGFNDAAGWQLLMPSLGKADQEVNNLAAPNPKPNTAFENCLPNALTEAELTALNAYVLPQWQKLHNQLCQRIKEVNAMPTISCKNSSVPAGVPKNDGERTYVSVDQYQQWVDFVTPPQLSIPQV